MFRWHESRRQPEFAAVVRLHGAHNVASLHAPDGRIGGSAGDSYRIPFASDDEQYPSLAILPSRECSSRTFCLRHKTCIAGRFSLLLTGHDPPPQACGTPNAAT